MIADDELARSGDGSSETLYRSVLGHFPTGVTVVTTMDGQERPLGFTCQAFMALSLEPPRVALAASQNSRTWPHVERCKSFCVNVLSERRHALIFASKADEKFEGLEWEPGVSGSPILADSLAWIECALESVHAGGDHLLAVGRVIKLGVGGGRPLLFYKGNYGYLGQEQPRRMSSA